MVIQSTISRLSLINQWRLDRGRIFFFLVVILLFSSLILYVIPYFIQGNTRGGIVGMVCGLAINFWFTCIARLYISSVEYKNEISSILEDYGYRTTGEGYYELPVHNLSKFRSQRVFIEVKNDELVITGPYNILKKVVSQLSDKTSFT